jgi:hypothetical protein
VRLRRSSESLPRITLVATLALLARFREGQEDKPGLLETGMECDVEKPALAHGSDLREAGNRLRELPVATNGAQRPRLLGDEDDPFRQEGEGPWPVEAIGHGLEHGRRRNQHRTQRAQRNGETGWRERHGDRSCGTRLMKDMISLTQRAKSWTSCGESVRGQLSKM